MPSIMSCYYSKGKEQEGGVVQALDNLKLIEEQLNGKKFFGGDNIGFLDIVLGWVAHLPSVFGEITGLKLIDADKFPVLSEWMHNFYNHPAILDHWPPRDKMITKYQKLSAAVKSRRDYRNILGSQISVAQPQESPAIRLHRLQRYGILHRLFQLEVVLLPPRSSPPQTAAETAAQRLPGRAEQALESQGIGLYVKERDGELRSRRWAADGESDEICALRIREHLDGSGGGTGGAVHRIVKRNAHALALRKKRVVEWRRL
nr:probable glutathione S-transferase [Ipomoea batatas]